MADRDAGADDDVRTVLAEIGAEEELAELATRVAELERELELTDVRAQDTERALRGELEVMRARVEDAAELVRAATDEHREAWSTFERRLAEVVTGADAVTARLVAGLRDDLAPRVANAALRADEIEAALRGELEAASGDLRSDVDDLRRELDGTAAELRAGVNLRAQQLEDAVGALRGDDGLQRERAAREEAARGLRTRLDELGTRIEDVDRRAAAQTSRHLAELGGLHRTIEEVGGRVEVLAQRVSGAVEEVANELATRVVTLAAEVVALRDSGVRHEARLAQLESRDARSGTGVGGDRIAAVEAQVASLAQRVEEAERVAQAAGRAIASAVRRARPVGDAGAPPAS